MQGTGLPLTGLPLIVQLQMHMDTRHLLSFGFYGANGIDFKAFWRKPAYECLCKHTCIWIHMYVLMCAHTSQIHIHTYTALLLKKRSLQLLIVRFQQQIKTEIFTTRQNIVNYTTCVAAKGRIAECKQSGTLDNSI